ncbi:MAG: DUF6062 family protein [Spirochaetales bacterium]
MAEQHVNYFALQKACEKKGCPLCSIIQERIDRYIDGMLFEHISDRVFRAQYRNAGGFCTEHSKILLSYRDGLAVAILMQGTLSDYSEDFKKRKMRKYKEPCPACAEKNRIERDFLTFIAEVTGKENRQGAKNSAHTAESDEELIRFFTASSGLCVPHYAQLVSSVRKIPSWLSEFQEGKFKNMLERTNRFIDFSAWGKQKEFATLSDADKVVWKELAETVRGMV